MIQSLPFLSAALIAAIEGRSINEFATWRELGVRAGELVRRRAAKACRSPRTISHARRRRSRRAERHIIANSEFLRSVTSIVPG